MSAVDLFASSRVLVVAGKGGVGKTTVGATIGLAASRAGLDVLLVELEGLSTVGAPFGHHNLTYEPTTVEPSDGAGRLRARRITPDEALADYLSTSGLSSITDRMARSGAVDVVATAAPGIRDLVTLGKIRQLEQAGDADLIVVDAPAAGHAITFLTSAEGLARTTPSGPIRQQADQVLEMLSDTARCQVVLVTVPEESPVTELIETAYALEDRVGVALGPVVMNSVWPTIPGLIDATEGPLSDAARYRLARVAAQRREIDRLRTELPLPLFSLPYLFATEIDRTGVGLLADALAGVEGAGR